MQKFSSLSPFFNPRPPSYPWSPILNSSLLPSCCLSTLEKHKKIAIIIIPTPISLCMHGLVYIRTSNPNTFFKHVHPIKITPSISHTFSSTPSKASTRSRSSKLKLKIKQLQDQAQDCKIKLKIARSSSRLQDQAQDCKINLKIARSSLTLSLALPSFNVLE